HREWVPGYRTRVWYPERYETRYDHHGRRYRVIISRGYYGWHVVRGHYETRYERVRQGGYYEYTCTRRGHHHDHYRR
ncbi:MAG: hypothetical protein ACE5HB_05690, partial [Terriglobia bacterium]